MKIVIFIFGFGLASAALYPALEQLKSECRYMQKQRDMYDSLYRAANTHLMHFQDSINKHCICK